MRGILFTRQYKGNLSEEKSNTYIDIDGLKIFKDFSSKDITIPKTKTKTKTEDKDKDKTIPKTKTKTEDKINNKISTINETSTILAKKR